MMASTLGPAAAPSGMPGPLTVTAYVHPATQAAWLDVAGELSLPASLRTFVGQLRRAHRRIPRGIEVVGVDLTGIEEITIDLAVLLSLESRMLGVRDLRLAVALRVGSSAGPGVPQLLERLQVWRLDEERLNDLSRAVAHARLEEQGWQRL